MQLMHFIYIINDILVDDMPIIHFIIPELLICTPEKNQ